MIHIVVTISGGAAEVFCNSLPACENIKVSLIDYDVKEEQGDDDFKIDTYGPHEENEIEPIPESVQEDLKKFS